MNLLSPLWYKQPWWTSTFSGHEPWQSRAKGSCGLGTELMLLIFGLTDPFSKVLGWVFPRVNSLIVLVGNFYRPDSLLVYHSTVSEQLKDKTWLEDVTIIIHIPNSTVPLKIC